MKENKNIIIRFITYKSNDYKKNNNEEMISYKNKYTNINIIL